MEIVISIALLSASFLKFFSSVYCEISFNAVFIILMNVTKI